MKTPPENHDLNRWLDAEMSVAEREAFARQLEADPALKAEAESLQQISAAMRAHLPAEMPVPHADFFNSQIQVRIAQMEIEDAKSREDRALKGTWHDWVRLPWLATAAAVGITLLVALWNQWDSAAGHSVILSFYAPNVQVQPRAFHSDEAQATVLMLEGLEEIPADRKVVGYHIERSEADQDVATTTLYDGANDRVLVVLARDVRNQPRLLEASPRG